MRRVASFENLFVAVVRRLSIVLPRSYCGDPQIPVSRRSLLSYQLATLLVFLIYLLSTFFSTVRSWARTADLRAENRLKRDYSQPEILQSD